MLEPRTVAVTVVMPTFESAGHASPANDDWEQRAAERGSPTRPCGRTTFRDFTSSVSGFDARDVSTTRFGWPPAWVVDGVTLKLVTDTAALAAPGNIAAAATPTARAHAARRTVIPTSMWFRPG